ncbi:hypothetical protein [Kitasatospora sp. NPDC088346]|uniref:hypothetical protein n=1 Tax=Kitasatospora sp. NPDC088346 TaxID=3364073 RepID=UPI003821DCC5
MSEPGSETPVPTRSAKTLLRAGLADTQHLPEQLALLAVQLEGHRAGTAVDKLRRSRPDARPDALRHLVVERGIRLTVVEGGAVGGPFMVLVPVAFCAALLVQIRMVLMLAALAGHDPRARSRVAELLVLQGVYPDVERAEVGLAELPELPVASGEGRLPRGTRVGMVRRMAYLLGVVGPAEQNPGRLRQLAGWVGVAVVVAVGVLFPLVWIPVMGLAYFKGTGRLGVRATEYYSGAERESPERESAEPQPLRGRLRPSAVLVMLRTLGATVLPLLALLLVVATDIRLVGSKLGAALFAVVAVSVVVATVQGVRHWHRRRQG